jgi:hypothetical protein
MLHLRGYRAQWAAWLDVFVGNARCTNEMPAFESRRTPTKLFGRRPLWCSAP